MKIVHAKKLEDCFDGSGVYGYAFDAPWTREFIARLEELGKLEYFAGFPKPLFRLIGSEGFQIKGVEGETTCRAIFPRRDRDAIRERFERLFSTY